MMYQMTVLFLVLFTTLTFGSIHGQPDCSSLSEFLTKLMQCRHIPGMVISMVKGGQVVYSQGHGYRHLKSGSLMDNNTKINIGSLTKAFTATSAAATVARGMTSWEKPLRRILGKEFRLEGDFRSKQASLRDVLSHRLGMPSYWGVTTAGLNVTRETLCMEKLQHFPSLYDFRSHFLYSNYPYVLAAFVTEVLTGSSWEEQVKELLFRKLGMANTRHAADLIASDWKSNTAYSYTEIDGTLQENPEIEQLPFLIQVAPAGGIFSTANDMAQWMMFHLKAAKNESFDDIVPAEVLQELYSSINVQTQDTSFYKPTYPVENAYLTYGMGFESGTYRGRSQKTHAGAYSSYNCRMTLLPEEEVGVWACVNGPDYIRGSSAVSVASYYALDLLLGEDPWLNQSTACSFPSPWQQPADLTNQPISLTDDTNEPEELTTCEDNAMKKTSFKMEDFEGNYKHPGFGIFRVFIDDLGQLRYIFGLLLNGELNAAQDSDMMTFYITLGEPLTYMMTSYPQYPMGFPVTFSTNDNGDQVNKVEVSYLELTLPPVFYKLY